MSLFNRRLFCAVGLASATVAYGSLEAASWGALSASASVSDQPSRRFQMAPARLTAPSLSDRKAYDAFRRRFITADGRVIDTYNGGVSHSEGQGWGMLMAVAFDDPVTFDSLYDWTRQNLRRPTDHLHAWRFEPNKPVPVADMNNATDGDLYIAGALARAARAWGRPELAADARAIGQDILALLVRRVGERVVLLPAAYGFERDGVVVNLSYYAFPMMREVAYVGPSPLWEALENDGVQLIESGRFGPWNLPPDWLRVDSRTGALSPAPGWPARFSYDAIRIPLNLAWGQLSSPGLDNAFLRYWNCPHPFPPAWVDLFNGGIAPYPAESGTRAVAQATLRPRAIGGRFPRQDQLPNIGVTDQYYSAALTVLSRIAMNDHRTVM